MTLKDIAKQLTTAVQTVPNLVQILRDGLDQAETGSDVEVTQVVTTGTEIANIKVGDDPAVKIYAPAASINYSTTEHVIGKWIDGSDLYEITLDAGDLPSNDSIMLDSTPANISHLISIEGFAYSATAGNDRPIPFAADGQNPIRADLTSSKIRIVTYTAWTGYKGYVTIRYTKAATS